jgi:peptide/nickel transport system substrate-binding protein
LKDLRDLARVHPALPEVAEKTANGRVSRREFLRTATVLGLSSAAAYTLAGQLTGEHSVPRAAAQSGRMGGTLRCSSKLPEITDPATFSATQPSNVTRHIIEYLTREGPDNTAQPWLATGWEANEDVTEWTFRLRQGVKWSNGDDFIADDVLYNFERWLDEDVGSANASVFSNLTETSKIDDHTVRLRFSQGKLSVPEDLYDYIAGIVHRDFDAMGGNFAENPIGTGPYALDSFRVGQDATLTKRNPGDYWGDEVYLDRLVFIDHGDDPSAGMAALASGEVDILYQATISQLDVIDRLPNVQLFQTATGKTGVARMQMDTAPFDDRRVRRAVQLCQNKERVLELAYRGRGDLANDAHAGPMHPEYADVGLVSQNHEEARRLLEEAGYPDGIDLELNTKGSPQWELDAVQALAEQCRPAGIRIQINNMPTPQFWSNWQNFPFGFTNWDHRPLAVQTYNLAYKTGAVWNESHYSNEDFDRLLEQANAVIDPEERSQLMARMEQLLQDDAVLVQPMWRSELTAASTAVKGFTLSPKSMHDFRAVWKDA